MSKMEVNNGGVSFLGLLFIVFLVLKLTHIINWSWWWVTAPLWGVVVIVVIAFIAGLILQIIADKCRRW